MDYEYDEITAEMPDVVSDEVEMVYVPKASNNIVGIAKFDKSNFNVDDSANVSIKDDYVDGVVKNTNYHIKSLASETNKNNLYGIDNNGDDNLVPYSNGIVSNSVIFRDSNGRAKIADPLDTYDIVNKNYADSLNSIDKAEVKAYTDEKVSSMELTCKAYTDEKVAGIVDSAPETLDTLQELAAALGDDPNFATTIVTELGKKAVKTEVDEALATKLDKSNVVQTAGQSDTAVMSQKATTDAINSAISAAITTTLNTEV